MSEKKKNHENTRLVDMCAIEVLIHFTSYTELKKVGVMNILGDILWNYSVFTTNMGGRVA